MSFEHPSLLWLTGALPLAVALGLWLWVRRRRRAARVLGSSELLQRLGAGDLSRFPGARAPLLLLAAASLGVAAAGPRWGLESVEEQAAAARAASRSVVRARRRGLLMVTSGLRTGGGRWTWAREHPRTGRWPT